MMFYDNKPLSDFYGSDRGTPIDRHFIENFLRSNAKDIKGRCLEVKNDDYTSRFGKNRVKSVDIMDVDKNNKKANIIADLRSLETIEDDYYDCLIITQVFQYIDDLPKAVAECRRVLKKGGYYWSLYLLWPGLTMEQAPLQSFGVLQKGQRIICLLKRLEKRM
jgi:SAM-dependent methyltransferase